MHQMAEEVMSQLSGVAAQIKRHESEPEVFQALLDEWNNAFPASLGAMGSPKQVAATLQQQTREIEELRETLDHERKSKSKDVADVLRSMDAQLQASRLGVITERRQLSMNQQHEIERYQALLREAEHRLQDGIEETAKRMAEEVDEVKAHGEEMLRLEQQRAEELIKKFRMNEMNHQRELDALVQRKEDEKDALQRKIAKLEDEVKRMADQVEAVMMYNPQDETRSQTVTEVSELDEPDFEAMVIEEEEEVEDEESDEEEEELESEEEEIEDVEAEDEEEEEEESLITMAGSSASSQERFARKLREQQERRSLKAEKKREAAARQESARLEKLRRTLEKQAKHDALVAQRAQRAIEKAKVKAIEHARRVEAKRQEYFKAKADKLEMKRKEKIQRAASSMPSSAARGFQEFKSQIATLTTKLQNSEVARASTAADLNNALDQINNFKRQLENQEAVNEAMRQALACKIQGSGESTMKGRSMPTMLTPSAPTIYRPFG